VFFARLGAAIAQLHSVRGSAYARSTLATDRHANWSQAIDSRLAQTADRYAAAGLELDALTTRACTRIAALATQVSTISTPTFVHSDLYLDNLLLGSGDVPVVLDFEHCGYADACVEFVKPTLFVFDGVPGARDALIDAYVAASDTDALDERLHVALGMELVWGLPFFEQWGDVAVADLYRSRLERWFDAS
ncbi:MAG: phosphotransferase, partial [Actinobacteria bacterium]|nr:phosphotransferase [Actinomycetota bacterium]